MKFLLLLSFLLFAAASSTNASSFFAEGLTEPDGPPPPPILDATGAPLQFGVPYYMSSGTSPHHLWKLGNGVSLPPPTPFEPCPKVIHIPLPHDRGTPVVFSSAVPNVTGNITIGSELIISFYNLTRPNPELCGESNSTWVMARTWNLTIGGEGISSVFRLSLSGAVSRYYLLQPVMPEGWPLPVAVGIREGECCWNLRVTLQEFPINLTFEFAKITEEDEDDKPVIIQMPRKMSV